MTKRQKESQLIRWSAFTAFCGAAIAGLGSQDPAMSLGAKWLALFDPLVVLGVGVAVGSAFIRSYSSSNAEPDPLTTGEVRQIIGKPKP